MVAALGLGSQMARWFRMGQMKRSGLGPNLTTRMVGETGCVLRSVLG
jgi:hypothetical protein